MTTWHYDIPLVAVLWVRVCVDMTVRIGNVNPN